MAHNVRIIRRHTDVIRLLKVPPIMVFVDGNLITPQESFKYRNHSPDGFNAGYVGSGPAQLALAILLEVSDAATAQRYYQRFKWHFLAKPEYQEIGTHEFTFTLEDLRSLYD